MAAILDTETSSAEVKLTDKENRAERPAEKWSMKLD